MSKHPTGERHAADFYATPRSLAFFLVSLLRIAGRVLEPSAGDGAFVDASIEVHGICPDVVELHPDRHPLLTAALGRGVATPELVAQRLHRGRFERFYPETRYDWVIGNPPFSLAAVHVQHALFCVVEGGHVAFLLPSTFIHTANRFTWLRDNPPWREYALAERPSFTDDDGTNMADYSLFVWRRGYAGRTIRELVSWDGRPGRATTPADREESIARVRALDWAA